MTVRFIDRGLKRITRELTKLSKAKIRIGFFDDESARIAAFQEFGTITIPPRPFMRTAIEIGRRDILQAEALIVRGVLDGKFNAREGADAMADFIRRLILKRLDTALVWAEPLAASTQAAKGTAVPLVDTGAMRDALRVEVDL